MNTVAIKKCVGGYLLINECKLGEPYIFTSFSELMVKAQEMLDGPETEKPTGRLSLEEVDRLLEGADGLHGV